MTSERKKPTAGFWITAALVAVLVGYPLSFGPVSRIVTQRFATPERPLLPEWIWKTYGPLGMLAEDGPPIFRKPLVWYLSLWNYDRERIIFPHADVGIGGAATWNRDDE